MSEQAAAPRPATALRRLLAPVVISVVLGPLAAGLALSVLSIVASVMDGTFVLGDDLGLAIFNIVFAYIIGWPVALLAGILVSIWMIRYPPNALVVVGAAVLATAAFMRVAASGVLGPVEENHGQSNFWFTLAFAVIAALGCWLPLRRFARTM